jgi:hypothetical protein
MILNPSGLAPGVCITRPAQHNEGDTAVPITQANLSSGGSVPRIEIKVGHAHFAKYEFFLFDATGKNPKLIGTGINSDGVPDIFDIGGPVTVLNQTTLFWQAVVASPTGKPGETFFVQVEVTQDETVLATDTKAGPLSGPNPNGFIRLAVG